mgnify:CR=1 FL=1
MRKNVLVSILAMTSASTLTAWADANVDQIKTNDVSDWQGAESGVSLENGIIVSQNGAAISQNIGKLVKGSYKITTTTAENVNILINGKALDNGMFEVTAEEEDIVISLEAVESGKEYKVGGLKLMLDFDFAPLRTELSNRLTAIINKIDDRYENYQSLYNEAMRLSAIVNSLKDEEGTDDKNAYEVYKDNALYKGNASNLHKDIDALEEDVNSTADNTAAYNNAMAAHSAQKTAFDNVSKKLEGIADETCKTYVATITADAKDVVTEALETFYNNAEAAKEDGKAAELCNDEAINKFTTEVSELIKNYSVAIDNAKANHEAYVRINNCITNLRNTYNESLTQIYNEVKDDPDVYADMREAAQTELNQINAKITKIEEQNGTPENHEGSLELENGLGNNWDVTLHNEITEITGDYLEKAYELKEIYANAKAKLSGVETEYENLGKIQAIKDKHLDAYNAIGTAIETLRTKIEDNNTKHVVVDYTQDFNGINDMITALNYDAAGDIANYNAYQAVTTKVDEKETSLTEATKTVNALTDETYSNEGKYAATENAVTDAIGVISGDALNAFNEGTCKEADFDAAFAEVDKMIADYIANAETAKENYLNVQAALASYNVTLDELSKVVTNPAVTVGTSGKTYGSYIDEFQTVISAIEGFMTTASTSTDDAYNKALTDAFAKTDAAETKTLANVVAGLKDSYAQDKENYDNNIADQAVDRLVTYIETLITTATGELSKISAEGKESANIEKQKAEIEARIAEQNAAKEQAAEMTDKTAAMAELQKIQEEIGKINTAISTLDKAAKAAQAHFEANETKYNEAINTINGLKTGDIKTTDPLRQTEFNDKKTAIEAEIAALKAELNTANAEESVADKWASTEDATGFGDKLDAVKKKVTEATNAAKASDANYAAYTAIKGKYDEISFDGIIAKAKNDINTLYEENVTPYTEAREHYTGDGGVISKLEDEKNSKWAEVKNSYEVTHDCVKQKEGYITSLTSIAKDINAVPADAKKNYDNYGTLAGSLSKAEETRADEFERIAEEDKTAAAQGYLEDLTKVGEDIAELKNEIDNNFKSGKYSAQNEVSVSDLSIKEINNRITEISTNQKGGIDEAIKADNDKRLEAINNALSTARHEYSNAITTINEFGTLTDPELVDAAKKAISEANNALSGILKELRDIETKATDEHRECTMNGEFFDIEETYKASIEEITKDIKATVTGIVNNVYDGNSLGNLALTKFNAVFNEVSAEYDNVYNVALAGYAEESKQSSESLKEAKSIIDDAAKASQKDLLVLELDTQIKKLNRVAGLLTSGKEEASATEWNSLYTAAMDAADAHLADLNKFGYVNDADGNTKREYIDRYNAVVAEMNRLNTEAEAAEEKNSLFAAMTATVNGLKNALSVQTANALATYNEAKNASAENDVNIAAYNHIKTLLDEVQAEINAFNTFIADYTITDEVSAASIQNGLTSKYTKLEKYDLQFGWCETNKQYYENYAETAKSDIGQKYVQANNTEQQNLLNEIATLKADQNKAANAVMNASDEVKDKVDAYLQEINNLNDEISGYDWRMAFGDDAEGFDWNNEEAKNDIKNTFLGFAGRMAEIRSELSKYYEETLESTVLGELNDALNNARTLHQTETEDLKECHQDVQNLYGDKLKALGAEIEAMQAEITKYEPQILFYENKLSYGINQITESLKSISSQIDNAQEPYTINAAAKARLNGELDKLSSKLAGYMEEINAFTYADKAGAQAQADIISEWIVYTKNTINSVPDNDTSLNEGTTLEDIFNYIGITDLNDYIDLLYKTYTIDEMTGQIGSDSNLTGLMYRIYSIQSYLYDGSNGEVFYGDKRNELQIKLNDIDHKIGYLYEYNWRTSNNRPVSQDIDGTIIDPVYVDYMTEALPKIKNKIDELNGELDALKAEAEDNKYVPGDVDGNKEVLVDDYMTIMNYVLAIETPATEKQMHAADVDGNGEINIGDITKVINIILGVQDNSAALTRSAADGTDNIALTADETGNAKRVAIRLNSSTAYVGCQLDVKLPSGVTLLGEQLGERAADHKLYSNTLADGTHRIVVSSMENAQFADNGDALIYLDLTGRNADHVTVGEVKLADAAGRVYSIGSGSETTGIDGVETDKSIKERIYSVGGQVMDKIKKGINIIRNSDGSTRKVVKK